MKYEIEVYWKLGLAKSCATLFDVFQQKLAVCACVNIHPCCPPGTSLLEKYCVAGTSLPNNISLAGTSLLEKFFVAGMSLLEKYYVAGTSLEDNYCLAGTYLVEGFVLQGWQITVPAVRSWGLFSKYIIPGNEQVFFDIFFVTLVSKTVLIICFFPKYLLDIKSRRIVFFLDFRKHNSQIILTKSGWSSRVFI